MPSLRLLTAPVSRDPYEWIVGCDYARITTLAELDAYITPALLAKTPVGVDFETNSLNVRRDDLRVVGVCISVAHGSARYIPVGHRVGYEKNLPWHEVLQRLWYLDTHGVETLWYNAKYDHEVLYRCARFVQGIPDRWYPERHFHEVMFGVWLAGCNHKSFGLKPSADRLLGVTMPTYKAVTEGRNFEDVDPDEAVIYGCADADCTRRLWLHPKVVAAVKRQREVYELERALIEPFRTMIRNGQYWDDAHLATVEAHLGAEVKRKNKLVTPASGIIGRISDQIRSMDGGATLNFDAPAQVASFFLGLRIALVEKTKGAKQYATGEDVLAKYKCTHADDCAITLNTSLDCSCRHQCKWGKALVPRKKGDPKNAPPVFVEGWLCHPAIERMIMRRSLTNYARNYVLKLREGIATYGPHLHFPFNQLGAPTGRMSAGGEKNAEAAGVTAVQEQSMPDSKKAVYLPDIRAGLIANDPRLHIEDDDPEGFDIAAIDYSQIELRVAANLSKEPAWIKAFLDKLDIHLANARLAYKQPDMPRYIDDPANPGHQIENPKRGKGKTMGFAVLFGAADETVAAHGGIAVDEASELLTNFWGGVAVLQRWVNQTHLNARCEKVVKTFLGRERPLHEWYTVESLTTRKMAWLARKGDREAVNTQIQGGAADIFKIAFVRVHRLIIERGWTADCQIILPMHDELVFRVRRRLFDEIVPAIMACMATHGWPAPAGTFAIANWPVAITTDAERGPNWGKALKKYTPAIPTPRLCEACGTPSTYALCTVCQRVENRVGDIQDVQRRVPLFKVDAGPDPRLEARTRVRPVH